MLTTRDMQPRGHALVKLTPRARQALVAAVAAGQRPRQRRRYEAILLLGEGYTPREVSGALDCSLASVYNWAEAWRREGVRGLREKPRGGGKPKLDARGERLLVRLLGRNGRPHPAQDWTVPLLRQRLAEEGYAVSERTVRRAIHRLGWVWNRPRYVRERANGA